MRKIIKTPKGYFTIYGWNFSYDFPISSALPFPNPLKITVTTAKTWLKEQGVKFEVVKQKD